MGYWIKISLVLAVVIVVTIAVAQSCFFPSPLSVDTEGKYRFEGYGARHRIIITDTTTGEVIVKFSKEEVCDEIFDSISREEDDGFMHTTYFGRVFFNDYTISYKLKGGDFKVVSLDVTLTSK